MAYHQHRMTQDRDGNYEACVGCGMTPEDIENAERWAAVEPGVAPSPPGPAEG